MDWDGDVDDEPLFYDDCRPTGNFNYYLCALIATVVVGLPLLFFALYKVYIDHQHHRDEHLAHREKMDEYREAKQGLAANLRSEVNSVHARYEMETHFTHVSMSATEHVVNNVVIVKQQ